MRGHVRDALATSGDLNDPDSDISKKIAELGSEGLYADLGLKPSVTYVGLSGTLDAPIVSAIHRGGNVVKLRSRVRDMIWDWIIALYLFLAGMGAGAFVLGVIAGWKCPDASKVKLAGLVIAPVAVGVVLMLMVDARAGLMNPLRFFGLLANPSSIMMWGVVLLSAFLLVGVVELALQWKTKKTPKWLDVVGVLLAVGVAGYTGMLLGDAHLAFPLWNQMVLPLLFLVSAASAGFAAVVLAGHALHAPELEQLRFTHTTGLVLPVLEAALIAVLLMMAQAADGSAAAAGAAGCGADQRRVCGAVLAGPCGCGPGVPVRLGAGHAGKARAGGGSCGVRGRVLRASGRLHAAIPGDLRGGCRSRCAAVCAGRSCATSPHPRATPLGVPAGDSKRFGKTVVPPSSPPRIRTTVLSRRLRERRAEWRLEGPATGMDVAPGRSSLRAAVT